MTASDSRLRQAALALNALHKRDQEWLLRRLLPGPRNALRSLLNELRSLGIARGLSLTPASLPEARENSSLNKSDVAVIDAADPGTILALLSRYPDQFMATLLAARSWPWAQAIWEQLPSLQRNRMLDMIACAPDSASAPWLDALLYAMASDLRDAKVKGAGE
jgi:hypothetical protein